MDEYELARIAEHFEEFLLVRLYEVDVFEWYTGEDWARIDYTEDFG